MTYKGYQSKVELDEEAGVFHGEVINTRDVITFQGTSVEELKQAFEGFRGRLPGVLHFAGRRSGAVFPWSTRVENQG
jgi:hypothetical protein